MYGVAIKSKKKRKKVGCVVAAQQMDAPVALAVAAPALSGRLIFSLFVYKLMACVDGCERTICFDHIRTATYTTCTTTTTAILTTAHNVGLLLLLIMTVSFSSLLAAAGQNRNLRVAIQRRLFSFSSYHFYSRTHTYIHIYVCDYIF